MTRKRLVLSITTSLDLLTLFDNMLLNLFINVEFSARFLILEGSSCIQNSKGLEIKEHNFFEPPTLYQSQLKHFISLFLQTTLQGKVIEVSFFSDEEAKFWRDCRICPYMVRV